VTRKICTATSLCGAVANVANGYIESFNGRLRDECLNGEIFFNLADAREKLDCWRRDYNDHRPHSSLADRTPTEFATIVGQRAFTLLSVPKAGPLSSQGAATAGQTPPALDRMADLPSESKMRVKPLSEVPSLLARVK
jgi:hypothetical protein